MKGPKGTVIPPRVIDKPPSAELRENQKDEDSLPPYPVLDAILERLVERDQSVAEIVEAGFDKATVKKVEGLALRRRMETVPVRAGHQADPKGILAGPALSDRQSLARRRLSALKRAVMEI
jgi:NH3-dependent NAD+ synthetase